MASQSWWLDRGECAKYIPTRSTTSRHKNATHPGRVFMYSTYRRTKCSPRLASPSSEGGIFVEGMRIYNNMKILDPGHIYELRQLGDNETQLLKFVKRSGGAITYQTEWPGLQTQEVLRALIDRTKYLDGVLPCKETVEALRHLRLALYWYEVRAARRKKNNINRTERSHDDHETPPVSVQYPSDVPFTEKNIEQYDIGEDGHIIYQ